VARVPFYRGAYREQQSRKHKKMNEEDECREHSALDRVPSRDRWPPAWLAELPGMPAEAQNGSRELAEPASETSTTEVAPDTPMTPSRSDEWPLELSELIEWFQANRDRLPQEPFLLRLGCRVVRPHRFYQAIDRDIAAGPAGARARYGLPNDLSDLRNLIEGVLAPAPSTHSSKEPFKLFPSV